MTESLNKTVLVVDDAQVGGQTVEPRPGDAPGGPAWAGATRRSPPGSSPRIP